jgi:hypothetical protein
MTRYGLCEEEATALRRRPCEVCGREGPNHIDHVVDGTYSGVLCAACNASLGLLGDDVRRIEGLLAYARRTR